ncbi:hypothetical protein V1387_12755 [Allomuricauda taeanensis]|uniref:hypothetical protein n=1 Tax=Flagellimonas taeanensis TaxID=1005926 RepID=UPI002E7C16C4|nr:hypothetical protein [Allomuricauda taeanensis]MEE1963560.1 hypothetical protein [Allomuricauda taeanensis]
MNNILALDFLRINPDRIKLFTKYPENWKDLIGSKSVSREELEARKYNELAKEYPEHFQIGMKKKELIEKIING